MFVLKYQIHRNLYFNFRTVQKLILPKSSSINFVTNTETKLLIIPTRDAEDYEIMEKGEEMSEMVSNSMSLVQTPFQIKWVCTRILGTSLKRNLYRYKVSFFMSFKVSILLLYFVLIMFTFYH